MPILTLLFGSLVGLSLGLTGGGGAIFAVPLLVYGLEIPARSAVGISLAAVGAMAFVGFLHRWRLGEVEVPTGLLFAVAGMIGAPFGAWLASMMPERALLLLFAGLMLVIAWRLWRQATRPAGTIADVGGDPDAADAEAAAIRPPACPRDAAGTLALNSRCAMVLMALGLATGVLSGLFGVGGGLVIVPALVLFAGMPIHRAVGTSLMVIAMVSASGVGAHLWAGKPISPEVTALFVVGGILGMFAGQRIGRRLSGPVLQRTFAAVILVVAAFMIVRNLNS